MVGDGNRPDHDGESDKTSQNPWPDKKLAWKMNVWDKLDCNFFWIVTSCTHRERIGEVKVDCNVQLPAQRRGGKILGLQWTFDWAKFGTNRWIEGDTGCTILAGYSFSMYDYNHFPYGRHDSGNKTTGSMLVRFFVFWAVMQVLSWCDSVLSERGLLVEYWSSTLVEASGCYFCKVVLLKGSFIWC